MPGSTKEYNKIFDDIFDKYYRKVRYYALGFLKNANDADEVAQHVFMVLWQHMSELDYDRDISGYIFTAARWKCLSILYKQKKDILVGDNVGQDELDIKLNIHRASYSDIGSLDSDEIYKIISITLDTMPAAVKETFLGIKFGEHTYKEMAELQGCSVKNIEHRMTNTLKALREALKDYLPLLLGFLFVL